MSETIPHDALVVVADGQKAILLRNVGQGGEMSLREERRLTPKDLASDGPSGARPAEQSSRGTDEATFAKQMAAALHRMHKAGEFKALVLVADPQTLGQLRDAMHKSLQVALVLTLHKNFTNHSVSEITKALG